MNTALPIITHSQMEAFQKCRRYHYNRYILGVRPEPNEDLRIGTAVHHAVDMLHQNYSLDDVLDMLRTSYEFQVESANTQEYATNLMVELEKCVRLVEGWHKHWLASPLKVQSSEQSFRVSIINPETNQASRTYEYGGKIDALVHLEDGRLAIYELKTTGDDISIGSDYWKTRQIDAQIARYMNAARALGYEVATILYDAIRKPETRPKQIPLLDSEGFKIVHDEHGNRVYLEKNGVQGKPRESGDTTKGWTLQVRIEMPDEYSARLAEDIASRPQFYFARVEVPRLDHELAEAAADMWDIAKDIRQAELTGRHYLNTRACRGIGRCEYLDFCCNRTDLAHVTPEGFVRVTDMHPELGEPHEHGTSIAATGEGSTASNGAGATEGDPYEVQPVAYR